MRSLIRAVSRIDKDTSEVSQSIKSTGVSYLSGYLRAVINLGDNKLTLGNYCYLRVSYGTL